MFNKRYCLIFIIKNFNTGNMRTWYTIKCKSSELDTIIGETIVNLKKQYQDVFLDNVIRL